MPKNKYKCELTVGNKTATITAASLSEFLYLLITELFKPGTFADQGESDDFEASILVKQYYIKFVNVHSNRRHSPMAAAGLEIDLARCYLNNMSLEQTVEWLKKERGFETSITAVGRYWTRFVQLPAGVRTV